MEGILLLILRHPLLLVLVILLAILIVRFLLLCLMPLLLLLLLVLLPNLKEQSLSAASFVSGMAWGVIGRPHPHHRRYRRHHRCRLHR